MSWDFGLQIPSGLEHALRILSDSEGTPLAGGTNLLIDIRSRKECPKQVVALGQHRRVARHHIR